MADTPFTAVDRDLLKRCLHREPGSWNDFVDRFLSLIYHTIGYTAHLRSARVGPEDVEDIAAEVLLRLVADDFKVLREFRKQSSLATYLTVIARRICVQRASPAAEGPRRHPAGRIAAHRGRSGRRPGRTAGDGEPGRSGTVAPPPEGQGPRDRPAVLPGRADLRGNQHRDGRAGEHHRGGAVAGAEAAPPDGRRQRHRTDHDSATQRPTRPPGRRRPPRRRPSSRPSRPSRPARR